MRTVVNAGVVSPDKGLSSKPTNDSSDGIEMRRYASRITPIAVTSFEQMMAVGRLGNLRSALRALAPLSIVWSPASIVSFESCRPSSVTAVSNAALRAAADRRCGLAGIAAFRGHRAGRVHAGSLDDLAHAKIDRPRYASRSVPLGVGRAGGPRAAERAPDRD